MIKSGLELEGLVNESFSFICYICILMSMYYLYD